MSFKFDISPMLQRKLDKLARIDNALAIAVRKKINKIILCDFISIQHYKNLRHELSNFKRVHIGSQVLVFRIKEEVIIFEDFDHHDKIYKKRF